MREITIIRKKKFVACLVKGSINIDGTDAALIKNGETITIPIDYNAHEIFAYYPYNNVKGNTLCINEGTQNITLYAEYSNGTFILYAANKESIPDFTTVTAQPAPAPAPAAPKSQTPSIISGIVIGGLLLLACLLIYHSGQTSILGLIAGAILSIASSIVIIAGGFWLLIIPLPFVYLFKSGCVKPNQSMKRKALLLTLSLILPILSIAILFLLKSF